MNESELVQSLASEWHKSGIESGDLVLIHSNIAATLVRYSLKMRVRLTPSIVLDSFIHAVGETGTLLFPLFNFDFAKGSAFDIRNTPSHMGALSEIARLHPKAIRTGHPIYSFAVLGSEIDAFKDIDNFSAYGKLSPFAKVCELSGKIAVLGLSEKDSMTFYHHVEEMTQVDYRYYKNFTGPYTDLNGTTTQRCYSMYVRDLERRVLTEVENMGDYLWSKGFYVGDRYNEGNGLRSIRALDMFEQTSQIIKTGKAYGMLYNIDASEGGVS